MSRKAILLVLLVALPAFATTVSVSTTLFDTGTRVGVRTPIPSATFTVKSSGRAPTDGIALEDPSSNRAFQITNDGEGLGFRYDGGDEMHLSQDGQLTVPNGLTVSGDIVLPEQTSEIQGYDRNHMIVLRGTHAGDTLDATSYYQYGGTLAEGKGHGFYTGGYLSTQVLRAQFADDGAYLRGPVGIGTSEPIQSLEVYGSGDQRVTVTSTDGTSGVWFRAGAEQWTLRNDASDGSLGFVDTSGEDALSVSQGGDLHIAGNILSEGDICIGACN